MSGVSPPSPCALSPSRSARLNANARWVRPDARQGTDRRERRGSRAGPAATRRIGRRPATAATRPRAQRAIERLRGGGYPSHWTDVVARQPKAEAYRGDAVATGAAVGAVAGGILGGGAGLLVGAGALAIRGVGPAISSGALAAMGVSGGTAAVGAGLGAATGGLIGALVGIGFSYDETAYPGREVGAGRTVVMIRGDADRAQRIIQETGGVLYPGPRKGEDAPPFVWVRRVRKTRPAGGGGGHHPPPGAGCRAPPAAACQGSTPRRRPCPSGPATSRARRSWGRRRSPERSAARRCRRR
jgi:hypothetical protein